MVSFHHFQSHPSGARLYFYILTSFFLCMISFPERACFQRKRLWHPTIFGKIGPIHMKEEITMEKSNLNAIFWVVPASWWQPLDASCRRCATFLSRLGYSQSLMPPAFKATSANDVGYGVYDLFDLGEFDQKGRFAPNMASKKIICKPFKPSKMRVFNQWPMSLLTTKLQQMV